MPLPAALAAKLAKRGIIAQKQSKTAPPEYKRIDFKGASACPNKNNIFHECTVWCDTNWKGVQLPETQYTRSMQLLLVKYPLPMNWTEIFDKGVARFYYWNIESDLVSWLPPKHPKAIVTKSAAKLRELRAQDIKDRKQKELMDSIYAERERGDRRDDRDRDSDDDDRGYRSKHSDRRDRDRDRDRDDRRKRDREDRHRRDREKRRREDPLDPMDPASYSDIPRGTWSDGLETNKGHADNTASGVLFQQRPYPAPGAVLAANQEKEEKERR